MTAVAPQTRPMLTCRREFVIEWGDCDPSGIVFNPHYFVWFDASLHALLGKAGFNIRQLMTGMGIDGIPLVDMKAKFLAPCRYGDAVVMETSVVGLHRAAFDLHHRLLNGGQLAVEAFETRVWTVFDAEQRRIRAASLPPAVASRLAGEGEV